MLTKKAAWWSTDSALTWKQLKEVDEIWCDASACEKVQQRGEQEQIHWVDISSPAFHYKLARLSNAPPVLYRKGNIALLDEPLLGVVWPRIPSSYLQKVTIDLCSRLSAYHLVTISWGAEGIDSLAHTCSLEAGTPTIVVLGWWFRRYRYRSERVFLQRIIEAWGLIISEWKLDQWPTHYTFPQRNRIIAGCAEAVFVPWAALWSWSLITVDFALQFGIPVVTVPWSYDEPSCIGSNTYLCQKKIGGTIDFDAFLSHYFTPKQPAKTLLSPTTLELSDSERLLLSLVEKEPIQLAVLVQTLMREVATVMTMLGDLEIKWLLHSPEPWWYQAKY